MMMHYIRAADTTIGDRHGRTKNRHGLHRLQEPLRLLGEGSRLRARTRLPGSRQLAALRARHSELSWFGSVDENGRVIEEERNAHQWRRVRYSYMDCRRQARKRGLIIRGPRKIWDSTIALQGMLYGK